MLSVRNLVLTSLLSLVTVLSLPHLSHAVVPEETKVYELSLIHI